MRALFEAVGLTWPPPPMPERALNMPGQQKHTKPMRTIWIKGELYLKMDEEGFLVFWGTWVPDSIPLVQIGRAHV